MQTRMGGVARMSLPDATRSDRVYPLLQNLDLENLAFATVQGVGNTLAIEEMNEDELRRLVLVNLARLTVSGEWNGLLTAGGGGGFAEILPLITTTDATQYDVGSGPPWNGSVITSQSVVGLTKPHCFPFIAPQSGALTAIGMEVAGAAASTSIYIGIYEQDSNFLPSTLLGYATLSLGSTGEIYQTSLSATITLTAGTQYWFSMGLKDSSTATLRALHDAYLPALGITDDLSQKHFAIEDTTQSTFSVPPSTFTPNQIDGTHPRFVIGLKY